MPLLELTLAAEPGLTLVERSTVDGVLKVRTRAERFSAACRCTCWASFGTALSPIAR